MENTTIYRRVLRRETHVSRTPAAVVVATVLLVVVLGVAALEITAALLPDVAAWQRSMLQTMAQPAVAIAASVVAAVLGIVLLAKALLPGRRSNRVLQSERSAVLIEDGVLADAVADAIAAATAMPASQLSVALRGRRARVQVTPTSGVPVDTARVADVVRRTGAELHLELEPTVTVAAQGVVA